MPFCTQCGSRIEPDKNFCTSCGVQIHSSSPKPQGISSTDYRVLGVITGLEHQRSFLKTDLFNLVVTPWQLLSVPVNKLIQAGVEQADADARAQNKGFFGRYKDKMNVVWASNFSPHFFSMTPEAIVKEIPETIQIPVDSIQEFTIKK